jgi:hypothetical protein
MSRLSLTLQADVGNLFLVMVLVAGLASRPDGGCAAQGRNGANFFSFWYQTPMSGSITPREQAGFQVRIAILGQSRDRLSELRQKARLINV